MPRARFAPTSTIRGTLVVLIAITLAPLVGFGAFAVVHDYRDQREMELRASAELARATGSAFEAFLWSVLRTEHAIAVSFAVHGRLLEPLERELAGVLAEFGMIRDMSWVDPAGTVLVSTEAQLVARSVWAREYLQEIRSGAEWVVTPVMRSLLDGRPTFIVARGFRTDTGALEGIVTAAVDAERLAGLLGHRSGAGRTALVDSAGTLVAAEPWVDELDWEGRRRTADHPWIRRALTGEEARGVYRSALTGERRIGAFAPIRSIGWVAYASRPIEEALAPVRHEAVLNAAAVLCVALLALAAAVVLARRIAEPLRGLERYAVRRGRPGRAAPVPSGGPAEVRRVARALEAMAARLEARRAEVEDARRAAERAAAEAAARGAELEAVFAALPIGLLTVDPSHRVVRANEGARELAGGAIEDLRRVAEEGPLRVVRADGRVLALDEQPHARALRGEVVRGEMVRLERGGAPPVWIAASAAPVRDATGVIRGAVATAVDLTELHALEEERETLMQTVSHDLRTPLHVVVGHAELLRHRGDEEVRRRAEAILASAGRMTRLIGDLVDAARLEAGHVALSLEPLDLASFLSRWKDRMAGALAMERVRIEAPAATPPVLADPARLDQILANLASNALKYSHPGSEVRVDLRATPEALRLSVADRGTGIPPDELPRLFERYYRARTAGRAEGLGLGLFITRKLVEAHGWRIEVASEVGAGSVFTLVIPAAADAPARSAGAASAGGR
jgi:signal transduction histidine kinase